MTRAEQAAKKAYPKEDGKVWHSTFGTFEFDRNAGARKAYQEGYEQAEKDLALTWKDIRIIGDLLVAVFNDYGIVSDKKIYTEILRQFNEQRNEK